MCVLEPGAAAASTLCSGEAEGKTVGEVRKDATEKAKAAGEAKETPLCCKDMDECCAPGYKKRICQVKPGYVTSFLISDAKHLFFTENVAECG